MSGVSPQSGCLVNIGSLAVCAAAGKQSDIGLLTNAAISWRDGVITFVGEQSKLPQDAPEPRLDVEQALVVPGLIDCHTHLAFAGWRAQEFSMRILGKSYLEIEQAGGGIVSTVEKTRAASSDNLFGRSKEFLDRMLQLGVTTVEAKSGYGLSLESELRLLNVYKELSKRAVQTIIPTFLGAHTFPKEFRNDQKNYVDLIVQQMLPAIAHEKLATFCDIFVEKSAFNYQQAQQILSAAAGHGLKIKLHADQFSECGGAALAVEYNATSADHLECTSEDGAKALADAGVVAVMLPFASLYTNQKPADARRFIERGCRVAVATDFNPGSAPSYNLPLAMFLGCTLNRMTPDEVLKAATINAAAALGIETQRGSLEIGKAADLAVIEAESVDHWMYHQREGRVAVVIKDGRKVCG